MTGGARIVVVGSSNTDMVVAGERLPAAGETVLGGSFLMAAGGKGANQAVAAARLGANVALVARIGADLFGDQAVRGFEREGIDTRFVSRDPEAPSGVALILVDEAGENLISVAPGANARLSVADVEAARAAIEAAAIVLLQLEVPLETVRSAARIARAAGALVILDPAPARELDDSLLADVSILTPNESEAERLTGIPVGDDASADRAAAALRARGVSTVALTLGARGCYLLSGDHRGRVAAPPAEAVDSTAAGDTFNGALAWQLARGAALAVAVETACRAAALSVTRRGAQPSMPTERQVAAAPSPGRAAPRPARPPVAD